MDVECQRDIRFKLNMAQIKYIHTHRFQSELVAYFLHFYQLQELLNHYRAALIGKSKTELDRGSRVKLEITARVNTFRQTASCRFADITYHFVCFASI